MKILKNRYVQATAAFVGLTAAARADVPTTMDGVSALGTGYIGTGTTVAIAAAILGFGWVGYRIAKKYTKGAMST